MPLQRHLDRMLIRIWMCLGVAMAAWWPGVVPECAAAPEPKLRFFASPYRTHEGGAVQFTYVPTPDVPKSAIATWEWDFDGDGAIDAAGQGGDTIDQVWYATFDSNRADANGVQAILPRLRLTTTTGSSLENAQAGITQDVYGFKVGNDSDVDREVFVSQFASGNPDIQINISASKRLIQAGQEVRLYAEINQIKPLKVVSVAWDFTGPGNSSIHIPNANTVTTNFVGLGFGSMDVSILVSYVLNTNKSVTNQIFRAKKDFLRIVTSTGDLGVGRSYRRGFPEEYDWDDLVKTYSAPDAKGDRYVYLHAFERAYNTLLNSLRTSNGPTNEVQRRDMAELANEILQGQLLVGNQRLVDALRIKYPRLAAGDAEDSEERLPAPPGVREELAAIEIALLDYQAALFHIFNLVHEFGLDFMRSRAPKGAEPYPEFPRYITFEDPDLSQRPIPIRNEFWQLTTCLDRLALGGVEKAKKLFRLSIQDPVARQEAKTECKRVGLRSYLGMALLAAGQSPEDFAANEGNSLLAHLKNARDLFDSINAGLNPLGNDGSFIPNESFAATLQDANEAVGDAREAEIHARSENREFDQRQATLRSELLSQRSSYATPLKLLTGLDPAEYNDLKTVPDQTDFRNVVRNRIDAILRDYPNTTASGTGEIGEAVLGVLDAVKNVEQRVNDVGNLLERVRVKRWANAKVTSIRTQTFAAVRVVDYALMAAELLINQSRITGKTLADEKAKTIAAAAGTIAKYYAQTAIETIRFIQDLRINDVELEAEIRSTLLDQGNLGISIDRARNQLDQARLRLENLEMRMDRLVEDLAHTRATAENLYFQDPSFRVVVSRAQRRAEAELDFAVDRLYRLAKTLEYEWTEPYQNPLVIPIDSYESAALENPLFDKFTSLDSVFNIRSADEAKDYLDALKAWDAKLRRVNVTSVRGPNHAGPISAEPISFREDLLFMRPVAGETSVADTVRQFRDYLDTKRVANPQNPATPSLELNFATTIEDNRLFPATGQEWNMRIHSIRVDLIAESGFNTRQVAEVELTQSGLVTLRRFWAEPPEADDLFKLTFNQGRIDRSAFTIKVPARINGATGSRPPQEFESMGLANRPIGATGWILRIDTKNPSNRDFDFSKLKDIVIRFTYTYGNPPEFPGL